MNWMLSFTSVSRSSNSDLVIGDAKEAGDASITLDQSLAVLEWEEGDEIVITTTDICDSSLSKSEVAVV